MRNKSGNQSLLSNGVARTHFMPPDGACILTVLKPLQSLTGGSRLDAIAKSAPDKSSSNQRHPASREKELGFRRYLYLSICIYAISYTSHFLMKFFRQRAWAAPQAGHIPR
jgi:hypothetical protein